MPQHLPYDVPNEVDERTVNEHVLKHKGPTGEGKTLSSVVNIVHTQSVDHGKYSPHGDVQEGLFVRSDYGKHYHDNGTHQLLDKILLEPYPTVGVTCEEYCTENEIDSGKVSTVTCPLSSILEAALEGVEKEVYSTAWTENSSTAPQPLSHSLYQPQWVPWL